MPQYEATVLTIASPIMLGEVAIMLWLLVVGARQKRRPIPAAFSLC